MGADTLRRLALAVLFGVALALSAPFRMGDFRLEVDIVLGWVALVPFVLMLRDLGPRAAAGWGFASGTLAYAIVLFWIYVVAVSFGGAPAWAGVIAVLLLAAYIGAHVALAAAIYAALRPRAGFLAWAVLPAAWTFSEYLRTFDLFGGFPWAYLGYAVHGDGPAQELAALGGVWGLSFLLACFAGLVAERRFVLAMTLLAASHALGFGLRLRAEVVEPEPARFVMVQANIPQDLKWDPDQIRGNFDEHLRLSRLAAAAGPLDLIIWPEAAVGVLLEYERSYADDLQALARETDATVLVGSLGFERLSRNEEPPYRLFNSIFAVSPDGTFVDRYDKSQLVPFGEYVPLRSILGALSAVASGLQMGDVTPGPGPRALQGLAAPLDTTAIAPLICYEAIYPSLSRAVARDGAQVLLNLTNDAWYGYSSAPHQFLAIAAMRSAETGLPMLRAANTGITAIVDPGGLVLDETPLFEGRTLSGEIPGPRARATLYTSLGDWVVGGGVLVLLALGIVRARTRAP